jgi:4-amino-4-deoxy-L-arabinose transferase-like glycosyltransferase
MTSNTLDPASARRLSPPAPLPAAADWILYGAIACSSLLSALVGAYRTDADTVAYFDISDAVRNHNWHSAINAYWFPLYPWLLTLARGVFGFRVQYEFMAARLLDAALNLLFVLAAVTLAASVRRLMLARGAARERLLPARTLFIWVAVVACFFASIDLLNPKPDTLISIFMLLAVAALCRVTESDGLLWWVAVGVCGGVAFWAKSFALPFFVILVLLAAAVNLRRVRLLGRLALALVTFALIAAPLVWQISAQRGRFTDGESGRLNLAWMVNHADRFNPVGDRNEWQPGSATASLKHPGEVLWHAPFIAYYGGPNSFGTTPQWTDVSYWSDGLAPRFVLGDTLAAVRSNVAVLSSTVVMRFQIVLLAVLLGLWGFRMRRASFADPTVLVSLAVAIASIGLYAAVYLEPRYIAFAFVMICAVYAATSLTRGAAINGRSLHAAVLIAGALIVLFGLQATIREWREARQEGDRLLQGVYSQAVDSAGVQLAALYPRGAEVACLGDSACWTDPYWAHYAGVRITAIVETGRGFEQESAEQGCKKLEENPAALDALRSKGVRAIVAQFNGTQPCSVAWRPLGTSPNFFYLPLYSCSPIAVHRKHGDKWLFP